MNADAAILPQREGFGALTRSPELAAAGIPVVTSEHASLAAGQVPGVFAPCRPYEREHLSAHNRQRSAGPIVHTDPREAGLDRLDLGQTRQDSADSCSERHVLD